MTLKGRPRIPDEEKKRRGTFRKSREHDPIQFTALTKVPPAPALLNDVGKEVWKNVCRELINLKILQIVDIDMLQVMCLELQHYHTCQVLIEEKGLLIEGKNGLKSNPAAYMAQMHINTALKIASQFGLTPNSRMKLKIGPKESKKNRALELIAS